MRRLGLAICSTHIPNLKCLRLPSNEQMKATQKYVIRYSRFEPPFGGGDLGVTHMVHLWLDGKRVDISVTVTQIGPKVSK